MKARPPDPFSALADPSRRAILDSLRRRGTLTAGQIAAEFSAVSRPAISRHLRVLREAGLVDVARAGREWRYTLNPTPLWATYERWLAPFLPGWEDGLERLKRQVEEDPAG